jgi:hypothetical protein
MRNRRIVYKHYYCKVTFTIITLHSALRLQDIVYSLISFVVTSVLIRSSYTLRCRGCFFILIILQTVGLLGRVISPSQGLCLNTGQHKYRINIYTYQTSMPCVGFEPTIPASCCVLITRRQHTRRNNYLFNTAAVDRRKYRLRNMVLNKGPFVKRGKESVTYFKFARKD